MGKETQSCCYWDDQFEQSCQLEGLLRLLNNDDIYYNFREKTYCLFHLPIETKIDWDGDKINRFIDLIEKLSENFGNFSGTHFPPFQHKLRIKKNSTCLNFSNCVFGDTVRFNFHTIIEFEHGNYHDFSFSEFGNTSFVIHNSNDNLHLVGCTFKGILKIEGGSHNPIKNADFSRSKFYKTTVFNNFKCVESLKFIESKFHALMILNNISIPQSTNFDKASFKKIALHENNEPSFRVLRSQFSQHKNRYMEGLFYSYEQRCHRKRFNIFNPARWLSVLYDWVSLYGLSYERVFITFLLIQVVSWAVYSKLLPSDFNVAGEIISPTHFTLAQIFKPFNLFEYKVIGGLEGIKDIDIMSLLSYITAIHSVSSFTLIAIGLVAIRWRFRRN